MRKSFAERLLEHENSNLEMACQLQYFFSDEGMISIFYGPA